MTLTKLTLTIPSDLRRRAKSVAALRNESVSEVVRRALEDYVADALEEADDIRAVDDIEARLARGEVRIYSHDDVWAEIDAIGADRELPA
jgi:predicted transcriptional regulator